MRTLARLLLILAWSIFWSCLLFGADTRPEFHIPQTSVAPVIDGSLRDAAWEGAKVSTGEWLTYNPVRGDKLKQTTEVWVTYDKKNLYFGFRCTDPEPDKIKASMSRRDELFSDDWVGLSLDSMFTGQSSYDMFVNPKGVQADILTSSGSGEDVSPDWVWDSAGKRTDDGYCVEIRLPLESIRFKSGNEVRMGLLFWRRVSRLGSSHSWPVLPSGKSTFECHATAILGELEQPRTLEIIPSLTYSYSQGLDSPGVWKQSDSQADAGLTVKYGLTSSITAEATVNPDFSQIESDAYQIEVNQRYPIFFSEKRPFFMEGMGVFAMAGSTGDGNMRTTVHTRKIIDPLWGLKLTGAVGNLTFGTLSSADQAPGRQQEDEAPNPFLDRSRYFNIFRGTYSLGKGTYVGGIYAGTEFVNEYNRVVGADVSLRFGEHQNLSGAFLETRSQSSGLTRKDGIGAQLFYGYNTDHVDLVGQVEHYDPGFQMDTAFYNRVGISAGWSFASYHFHPDKEKHPWVRAISPLIFVRSGRDRLNGGHDLLVVTGFQCSFTRQGYLRMDWAKGREAWVGRQFDRGWLRAMGEAQFTRWLYAWVYYQTGDSVYYDRTDPFQGRSSGSELSLTFQPTSRLRQNIGYNRVAFDRASTGLRVYTVDLVNARTAYQFTRRFYLRAILQYDSSRTRVLTDFLGSYEVVPGTVAYAGYGALLNRQAWRDGEWRSGEGEYLTTRRGVFFKVSYLHRF
jgi:hypothetical protein